MKASILTSIVLVFASQFALAQNYQTVQSDEIHYFTTQNHEYVLASKTETVSVLGPDSVFYSYKTLREDENLNESDPCKYYLGSPWTGSKIEIKSNGQNIFYNKDNEPIYIETQAALNDTFLVYTYSSGDWIKGVVSNHIQLGIFGTTDSIKIIDLFSNIPMNLQDPRFILSKNHGFVETFAPYTFPEPYLGATSITGDNDYPAGYSGNFELVGIDDTNGLSKPTTAEVFDYEIGDEFKFYSSVSDESGAFTEYFTERTVTNKFDYSPDSVVYFIEKSEREDFYPPSGPATTNVTTDVLSSVSYSNLDSWNTSYLPEEFNGVDGWSTLFINACGDVEEVIRKQAFTWDGVSTCVVLDPFGNNILFSAIKGVGWIPAIGEGSGGAEVFFAEMVYYNKMNGSSCGSDQFTVGLASEPKSENNLSVYPNPTNGEVHVQVDNNSSSDTSITIVDKQGRPVRLWKANGGEDFYLDLSELRAGIYTLIIETDGKVKQEKLVKN